MHVSLQEVRPPRAKKRKEVSISIQTKLVLFVLGGYEKKKKKKRPFVRTIGNGEQWTATSTTKSSDQVWPTPVE